MSLEEDLKKIIPASKEDIRIVEASKKRPPPSPEKVEAQLRASGAFRGTYHGKQETDKNGQDENKRQG